ncbi:kinase suppressor of Ras 2-like isoform X1 [Asterias rubens]|uniref:kinase suppressor of Ras 2-like isoform X1 n=1 Tax=Asterias rubens TaxID=7604 RepID=UPI001455AD5A|nr:kinase suppressor of Ras 2-like isoform X1 [Asterias rubens]
MADEHLAVSTALENLRAIQSVIDGRISSLDGLRKLGSSDYTQHEIKTVEGKLVQLFGRQLAIKQRVKNNGYYMDNELNQFPNLRQWLHVVDIQGNAVEKMLDKLQDLSALLDMAEPDIRSLGVHCDCDEKLTRRLLASSKNLKKAFKVFSMVLPKASQLQGGGTTNLQDVSDREPDSSSYTSNSPESVSPQQKRTSTSSIGSASSEPLCIRVPITPPYNIETYQRNLYTVTPPQTPKQWGKNKTKGTPPPNKRMITVNLAPPDTQLKRCKSTEASLPNKIDIEIGGSLSRIKGSKIPAALKKQSSGGSCEANLNYSRRFSEDTMDSSRTSPQKGSPGRYNSVCAFEGKAKSPPSLVRSIHKQHSTPNGAILTAYSKSETNLKQDTLAVPPRSPRTPRSNMVHSIKHRFSKKKFFPPQNCDYCHKIMLNGYKCKDCRYVCHNKCQPNAEKVHSCGLPPGYEKIFKDSYENKYGGSGTQSPLLSRRTAHSEASLTLPGQDHRYPPSMPAFSLGESSSNPSSTNSSTSSSPVPFTASSSSTTPPTPAHPSPSPHMECKPQFQFPDVAPNGLLNPHFDTYRDSIHASINSDRTITVDSHNSNDSHDPFTDSERTLPEKVEYIDDVDMTDQVLHRKNSAKSNVLSEWEIPPDQLVIQDLVGTGRFGPVYKGKWHGEVAVKMLNIDMNDDEQLQAFKTEVSQFKKTRHDYVVLFMGTYLKPPNLAIVTSLCTGNTLYTSIHQRNIRFGMNRTVAIATQIAQGMGYLHAKGIIHKDLKSKNIFLERGKVVITDFALFSIMRLSRENRRPNVMIIPDGWLCYLGPELIRSLRVDANGSSDRELPFSTMSDVYAFGTIWYELLAGDLPFHKQAAESIIWRVGKGIKQPLSSLQASRDVKDILMVCWNYNPEKRQEFTDIIKVLNRLPKKRGGLHRSPSHPLHLSRSAESVL